MLLPSFVKISIISSMYIRIISLMKIVNLIMHIIEIIETVEKKSFPNHNGNFSLERMSFNI